MNSKSIIFEFGKSKKASAQLYRLISKDGKYWAHQQVWNHVKTRIGKPISGPGQISTNVLNNVTLNFDVQCGDLKSAFL